MGMLINSVWHEGDNQALAKESGSDGNFERTESQFRNWITKDGSVGKTGKGGFKAENNRYHLYVSYACPWAHRTLIFRSLKGLEKIISLSIVNWFMGKNGWTFEEGDGVIPDRLNKTKFLYQIYTPPTFHQNN